MKQYLLKCAPYYGFGILVIALAVMIILPLLLAINLISLVTFSKLIITLTCFGIFLPTVLISLGTKIKHT